MPTTRTYFDAYVFDTLMADLAGHDRSPAAFLVYVALWHRARGANRVRVPASLQELAEQTGLSKRGVQGALQWLGRRRLIVSERAHPTAVPEYGVLRPWIRRDKGSVSNRQRS